RTQGWAGAQDNARIAAFCSNPPDLTLAALTEGLKDDLMAIERCNRRATVGDKHRSLLGAEVKAIDPRAQDAVFDDYVLHLEYERVGTGQPRRRVEDLVRERMPRDEVGIAAIAGGEVNVCPVVRPRRLEGGGHGKRKTAAI